MTERPGGTAAESSETKTTQIGALAGRCTRRLDPDAGHRVELSHSETSITAANDLAVRRALEAAGVEFIDENGGGPGVRLRDRQRPKQPK